MENNFCFESFANLLKGKDVLTSDVEVEEFFEQIYEILDEGTNVFEEKNESEAFERVAEILTYIPVNTFLELKSAKIEMLLKCDESQLKKLCYSYSRNLVNTNDYYDLRKNDFGFDKPFDESEDDGIVDTFTLDENSPNYDERYEAMLKIAAEEEKEIFTKEHLVESFIEKDDFDENDSDEFEEF